MEPNKYLDTLKKYETELDDEAVKAETARIIAEGYDQNNTQDVLKFSLSCIDLTSLNPTDNDERIREFTARVNKFEEEYPELENVASICVYPNFAETVSTFLDVSEVDTTVVAAGFPEADDPHQGHWQLHGLLHGPLQRRADQPALQRRDQRPRDGQVG